MDESFVRDRITQLRMERNISEYRMSLELGHSKGYIQSISSGRSMPSMSEFFAICEYFSITPAEFFTLPADSDRSRAAKRIRLLQITPDQEKLLMELVQQIR